MTSHLRHRPLLLGPIELILLEPQLILGPTVFYFFYLTPRAGHIVEERRGVLVVWRLLLVFGEHYRLGYTPWLPGLSETDGWPISCTCTTHTWRAMSCLRTRRREFSTAPHRDYCSTVILILPSSRPQSCLGGSE